MVINHYIQMIPPFLWLKFPLRWLKSLAPSWLAKVSKLCTTGNTGSWGWFFFSKKSGGKLREMRLLRDLNIFQWLKNGFPPKLRCRLERGTGLLTLRIGPDN